MRRSILSSLRAHLGRLVAACLAIVLGVGFGTLAMTAHSTATHLIDETIGKQNAGVDAVVEYHVNMITAADYTTIKKLPQVVSAITETSAFVDVTWPNSVRPSWFAVDAKYDTSKIAGPGASAGRLPTTAKEIALPAKLMAKYKLRLGQQLRFTESGGKVWTPTVVGILDDSASLGESRGLATESLVRFLTPDARIDHIKVAAAPGVSQAALAAAVTAAVGTDLEVFTGEAWIEHEILAVTKGVDVIGGMFGMFAVIALFVACLVIANTFTIIIAQRTREMALLRCVGASRRQVFVSVIAEASVVGVLASTAGVVLGLALAAIALAVAKGFGLDLPSSGPHVSVLSMLVPLVLGVASTLLAAVVPARRATRVAPLAALRPELTPAVGTKPGVLRLVVVVALLAGGGVLLAAGAKMHQVAIGVVGGVISFVGVLAIGTLLVPALVRLLGILPARTGVPARIAVANAVRNPRRTAATTSALLIGVTLISLTCVGIASVRKTFDATLHTNHPIDLTVTTSEPVPANAARQLESVNGISHVAPIRTVALTGGRLPLAVTGVDESSASAVVHDPALVSRLKAGSALLDVNTMSSLELKDGQAVTLVSGRNRLTLTAFQGSSQLGAITVTTGDLNTLAPNAQITGFWLAAEPKADGAEVIDSVRQSLPTVKELTVDGGLATTAEYTKVFDILLSVAIGLLGVSVVIALVGVGNTLSLSVLERTRENALLRAMGLTRRQLGGMLAVESLLMALVAAALGITLGLVYGWTGTAAMMGGQIEGSIQYAVPVKLLVVITTVAIVAGLLASVLPSRRAAGVAPAAALVTE
ncbi:FtsX-like permease family protein [Kribbella sp. NPDC056861]|uniref:ABC transporter permease n=1 Tax=Kribbella sp. NPDC056861 TaxID=3154857 RepID=UPI00344ACCBC